MLNYMHMTKQHLFDKDCEMVFAVNTRDDSSKSESNCGNEIYKMYSDLICKYMTLINIFYLFYYA